MQPQFNGQMIVKPDGNLFIEKDGRGQITLTCHRCRTQMATFTEDSVNPWMMQHQLPLYYGNDLPYQMHWGGPKQCGQTGAHKDHGWWDVDNCAWTCAGRDATLIDRLRERVTAALHPAEAGATEEGR